MVELGLVLGLLGSLFFCAVLARWNELRYGNKGLPGGSLGWPFFGETMEFLKHGPNFMKNQRYRYGTLFKTHIIGCPTVVSMDPDVNRFIFMNEGKGLVPGYPQSMLDILGKWNIANVHGSLHKSLRGVILSLIGPSAIREELLPKIDSFMESFLLGLGGKIIDIQEKTREMTFLMALKLIAGIESGETVDILIEEFHKLVCGTLSLPIDIPGSNYRRAFQARKKIVDIFADVLTERRKASASHSKDMLHSLLLVEPNDDRQLSDDQIIDLLITIVYSGFETVSTTAMMSLKYLHDHPRALEDIREEHLQIRKRTSEAMDWEDYKSMNFTRAVILETMRLATIVNGVLRKTTVDLDIDGFTVPKGWKIYVYTRENNYDPFQYTEPLQFNPWRWLDKNLESHHYFTLFGGGSRLCPGKELGIVQVSIFLHYFLTRYRWEEIGGEQILQFPRVEAPNGLHFRVFDINV